MSADLIMTMVVVKKDRRPRTRTELRDIARRWLNRLTKEQLNAEEWMYNWTADDEENTVDFLLPQVEQALADIDTLVSGGFSRDTNFCTMGDYILIATGGMTWGDDPTESFSTLSRFDSIPGDDMELWNEMEVWWPGQFHLTPAATLAMTVPRFTTAEEANQWMDDYMKGHIR